MLEAVDGGLLALEGWFARWFTDALRGRCLSAEGISQTGWEAPLGPLRDILGGGAASQPFKNHR